MKPEAKAKYLGTSITPATQETKGKKVGAPDEDPEAAKKIATS